ncbi:MAG TPA: methylated-DNA--[protein]-cysteine S-methyltransferase [Thermomicrobiales bacterium]|nr:methylated-DNA--[protein]-cysteine S-methyltransferase [Thermomicrobiales bacterium]
MQTRYLTTVDSPAGPLHIVVTEAGALTQIAFGAIKSSNAVAAHLHARGFDVSEDDTSAANVIRQLAEYAAGTRHTFDLRLERHGSAWEEQVWTALCTIPYGETRSYGQIAALLGDATKARAVGWANNANPIPVVVPCHRVIGAQGNLTGFGGGIEAKIKLLAHEGALLPGFA